MLHCIKKYYYLWVAIILKSFFRYILIWTNPNHPQMFHRAFRPLGISRAKRVVAAESSNRNYASSEIWIFSKIFCNILIGTNCNRPEMFHQDSDLGGKSGQKGWLQQRVAKKTITYDFDCFNTYVNTNSGQIQFLLQTNFKTVPLGLNTRPGARAKGWWQQRAAKKTMHQMKYEYCQRLFKT